MRCKGGQGHENRDAEITEEDIRKTRLKKTIQVEKQYLKVIQSNEGKDLNLNFSNRAELHFVLLKTRTLHLQSYSHPSGR